MMVDEETQDDTDEGDEGEVTLAAPDHWSDEDKDSFSELPDEAKPLYLEKVKSIEAGYNRKFEDLASERKEVESYKGFKDMFAPYEQKLAMAGTNPELYTRQLLATAAQLEANPLGTLEILAKTIRRGDRQA